MSGFQSNNSSLSSTSGSGKLSRAERRKLAEQEAQQRIATELNRSKPIDATGKPSPSQKESRGTQKAALNSRAEEILLKAEEEAKSRVERLKQEKLDDYHKLVADSESYGAAMNSRGEQILQKAEEEARSRVERLKQEKLNDYHKLLADSETFGTKSSTDTNVSEVETPSVSSSHPVLDEIDQNRVDTVIEHTRNISVDSTNGDDGKRGNRRHGSIGKVAALWEKRVHDYEERQSHNPFSDRYVDTLHFHKGDEGYGKPAEGSATEARGQRAHIWVDEEIKKLIKHIKEINTNTNITTTQNCKTTVTFKEIFDVYQDISNTVVGILRRARSRGVVHFVGHTAPDMLYQGTDDDVVIELLHEDAMEGSHHIETNESS